MGTNFFWYVRNEKLPNGKEIPFDRFDPSIHLGRRSASGPYCFSCGETLCKEGEAGIHYSKSKWHDTCPKCGAAPEEEGLGESTAGVELGFAQPRKEEPSGVRSCSSFTWAQDPARVFQILYAQPHDLLVKDEYERIYTGEEFRQMITINCPVQYLDSIGKEFS